MLHAGYSSSLTLSTIKTYSGQASQISGVNQIRILIILTRASVSQIIIFEILQ